MTAHVFRHVAMFFFIGTTVSAGARRAISQQPPAPRRTLFNSEQVPRDVVLAIFQAQSGNSAVPDLIIGDVPEPLKSKVPILPGARILATLLGVTSSQIYLEVPARPDSLTSVIWRELPKLGW